MSKIKPRVKVPKTAAAGEAITIKTLISHPMESGFRKNKETGELIPRQIINKFVASYNGEEVISVDMDPAISSNPYFEFSFKPSETGEIHFTWTDDDGSVYETKKKITVS